MQGRTGREVRRPFLSRLSLCQCAAGTKFQSGFQWGTRARACTRIEATPTDYGCTVRYSVMAYGYLPLPLVLHHHTSNASTELHFDTSNGPEQEGHDGVFGRKWGSVTMDAGGSTSSASAEVRDGMFWFRFVSIQTCQCHSLSTQYGHWWHWWIDDYQTVHYKAQLK